MCHHNFPLASLRDLARQQRWNVLDMTRVVQRAATTGQALQVAASGNQGGRLKQCLCSPTGHPGSFRCRHHHGEYVWGGGGGGGGGGSGLRQAAARTN